MYPDNIRQILLSPIPELIISIVVFLHYRKSTKFEFEKYHTFWPRFFAAPVDNLVFWPLTGLLFIFLLLLNTPAKTLMLISFIVGLVRIIYRIYFTGRFGQTIGKMASKVKVVDAKTGQDISYKQAILRNIIVIAINMSTLVFFPQFIFFTKADYRQFILSPSFKLVALLFIVLAIANIIVFFSNDKRRAIHDYIAGTVVVRTNIEDAVKSGKNENYEPLIAKEKPQLRMPNPYF